MFTGPLKNFEFELKPMGDTALLARLRLPSGSTGYHALDVQARQERMLAARRLAQWLQHAAPGSEFVAGYDSVLIPYNPLETNFAAMAQWVQTQIATLEAADEKGTVQENARLHRIPVLYGGEYGPDLAEVAQLNGLSEEAVIAKHSGAIYTGYLVGFSPGFTYLGALPPEIDAPRRPTPRPRVPARSVALAAGLTGVYPAAMPGGWRIIGQTPCSMFEAESDPPVRFLPGDRVQFFPITPAQLPEYEISRRDLSASLVRAAELPNLNAEGAEDAQRTQSA